MRGSAEEMIMSKQKEIQILDSDQNPEHHCEKDEIYVQQDDGHDGQDGWWVMSWDGREPHDMGGAPTVTSEEAHDEALKILGMIAQL